MKNLLTKQERNQYAEELHGAGFVGLTKALNTYDKELKVAKFSTYACTCIAKASRKAPRFSHGDTRRK